MKLLSIRSISVFFYSLHLLIFAGAFSWLALAKSNFMYPMWHNHFGINEGIQQYAPQNRYRFGYVDTTAEERYVHFAKINQAIHSAGEGLGSIWYMTKSSNGRQPLLTQAEIIHLQDVANLIDFLRPLFWYALFAFPFFLIIYVTSPNHFFSVVSYREQAYTYTTIVIVPIAIVILVGAEDVFNQLHVWVFPDEHQWFFYYQDSLMSTIMLAPKLFGYIAILWGLIIFILTLGISLGAKKILSRYKK